MGAPHVSPHAPTLIVVRATTTVAPRTLDALDTARRRGDRLAIARPKGCPADPPRLSTGRRIDAVEVDQSELLRLAAEHAASCGGPTVIVDSGAFGFGNRWLIELTEALDAHGVVLPLTNAQPWPNTPDDLPDHRSTRTAWREFARSLERHETRPVTAVSGLAGPCVALSADAARLLAAHLGRGADTTAAGICRAASDHQLTVGQVRGVYVHHESVALLLSACMIMKDEEDNLERCLGSLAGLVDEIVIYDTGSTDGSVDLARRLGATVIPGYWDDDFSRARNAARAACRGAWLLHIDADEMVEDALRAAAIRPVLERDLAVDLLAIDLFNMTGTELAPVREPAPHLVPRVLHRARCHWNGALHEHPVPVSGRGQARTSRNDDLTLAHFGYLNEVVNRRDKRARNARIAENMVDDHGDLGRIHFDRARTHLMNGQVDDAVAEYRIAADVATNAIHRRCSLEHAALLLMDHGRVDEAEEWIARRETIAGLPGVGRWLRARQAMAQGRPADTLAALDGITDYVDTFSDTAPELIEVLRAEAHLACDQPELAAEALVRGLAAHPAHNRCWVLVMDLGERVPGLLDRAAAIVPDDQIKLLAGKLLNERAERADPVAEALWTAHPGAPAVLALASQLAPRLGLERASTWAVRLRAAGLTDRCPLRAIARNPAADPVSRLQAAYLGAELFDDDALRRLVDELGAALPTG